MPTKGSKPTGKASSAGSKKAKGGKQRAGGKKKKKKKDKASKVQPEVDILSPAAMYNLYYISHNVANTLALRGFQWPGIAKKKRRR
uniref:small lysine-rich protein 1 n=1 Tax=Pristiophorus japonicus TaxID=55135 RepID=UPI00398E37EE